MERMDEPTDGDERSVLLGWLAFHRAVLATKCDGLAAGDLVTTSAPPSPMTLLGLVRHLTEMERVYGAYALGPTGDAHVRVRRLRGWRTGVGLRRRRVDGRRVVRPTGSASSRRSIRCCDRTSLDAIGTGNRRSVRWNLQKLVGEYARHNGHADLLRERIDGSPASPSRRSAAGQAMWARQVSRATASGSSTTTAGCAAGEDLDEVRETCATERDGRSAS